MPKESRRRDSDSSREKKRIRLIFQQVLRQLESDRSSSNDNDSSSSEDIQNNEQVHEVQVHREDVKIASEPDNNEGEQLRNDNINISQFFSSEPNTDTEPIWGPEVEPVMASHWNKFTELGIKKSEKKELLKKYPVPKNMTYLKSPILNPEIMEYLNDDRQRKEDECMSTIQGQIGNGLSALAVAVDTFCKEKDGVKLVPQLLDAGKILTDVFHMLSTNRKYRLEPHMNPVVRNIVLESKSDKFLCGQDFPKKVEDMQTGIALNDLPSTKVATNSGSQNASTSLAGSSNYQRQNKKIRVNNENREIMRKTLLKQDENIPAQRHPISAATLKTYLVTYKKWEDFCQRNHLDMDETEVDDIIAFFKESLEGGASLNTLSNDRSALKYFLEFSNDDKKSIKKFFKEIKINHPGSPEQVIDCDPSNFIHSWNQAENAGNFEN